MLLVCVRMVLKGTIRFAADVGRIQIGCEHPKHVELTFAQWFDQRLFDGRSGPVVYVNGHVDRPSGGHEFATGAAAWMQYPALPCINPSHSYHLDATGD